jgi:hypothetical protein
MSARPLWRPVVVREEDREATMNECPSEDVLTLYASTRPEADPDDGELMDGWTAQAVAGHLTLCPTCRSTVEVSIAMAGALRDDRLGEPAAEFWDDMADSVMRSLDAQPAAGTPDPPRAERADEATVIPLRRPGQLGRLPASATERRTTTWLWAAAAALALVASLGAYLLQRDGAPFDTVDGGGAAPAPVASGLPDAAAAAAAAAALGLSLDPIDTGALAEVDAMELGGAASGAGVSSLRRELRGANAYDVEAALNYDDAISELFEMDADALEEILTALESKT